MILNFLLGEEGDLEGGVGFAVADSQCMVINLFQNDLNGKDEMEQADEDRIGYL